VTGDAASAEAAPPARRGPLAGLTRNVFVLGAASCCTDIASEMLAPVRIIFLVLMLGTPLPLAGLIEGVAESTASLLKIVAGRLAGRVAWRRPLILGGYGLSAAAKPLLALAGAWPLVLALVFLDRIGKGLRGSPRDALLADATPPAYRGKAFGLHRALDTAGAALGPLLTVLILARNGQTLQDLLPDPAILRRVFAWSAPAGAAAVLVLLLFLRPGPAASAAARTPAPATDAGGAGRAPARPLGAPFWRFTAIATLFALGNSSDAFLFLRTIGLESWLEAVPLLYCGYNLVYAALATPLGALSDRWGRVPVLLAGYAAFALVYVGWAVANQGWHTWVLCSTACTRPRPTASARRSSVDLVPRAARGRALGWFNGLTGFAALPANLLAGLAWDRFGPGSTFTVGAALAGAAFAALLLCRPALRRPRPPA